MSKKNVPQIRFPGFDGDWEQCKLKDLCESLEYGINASAVEYDGKHKFLRITDIDDDTNLFTQDSLTSPDVDFDEADNFILTERDVVFARTGATVGKTYLYRKSDGLVYYAGFLIRARISEDFSPEFVFQNTLTTKYKQFISVSSQRSGQPGVNAKEYGEYEIMIPSIEEQESLGSLFNLLDMTITLHQRKLDDLKKLKSGLLQKMFPQKGEKVPQVRFPGFTGDWEQRKLSDLAEFSKGSGYSKADIQDEGTPIILYGRLYTNYQTKISSVDTFAIEKPKSVLSKGNEVIVPASGETPEEISRASAVLENGIILGGDLNIITPDKSIHPVFLATILSSGKIQRELSSKAQGKAVVHLHNSDLKEVTVMFPSVEEQSKINDTFDRLDETITLHQKKIDDLNRLKSGLLKKMFV